MSRGPKSAPKPRRRRGEGSIRFDAKRGLYCAQVTIGGKRKTVARKSEGDLIIALDEAKRDLRRGAITVKAASNTIGAITEHWIEHTLPHWAKSKAPGSMVNHRSRARRWIILLGASKSATKLSVDDIEAAYRKIALGLDLDESGRKRRPGGERHIRLMRTTLGRILADANRRKVISRDPIHALADAEIPVADCKPEGERRALAVEEMRAVLEAAKGERLFAMFVVSFATGARPGELCGLLWDAVHLDDEIPHIDIKTARQRQANGLYRVVPNLKTDGSARQLELPAAAVEALRAHRSAMLEERLASKSRPKVDLVFPTRGGTIYTSKTISRMLDRVARRAEVERFVPYEARHTFATVMLDSDVNKFRVVDMMGHTNDQTIQKYYRHRSKGIIPGSASVMGKIIS